jgi:hypothetical protein
LPVRVLPGATLVDELLPPVLEPAQQLGAIIRMANSIAEDVICDRAKRIRDQSASWKDGVRKRRAGDGHGHSVEAQDFFTALRHSNFVICRGYFEHPYMWRLAVPLRIFSRR